MRFKDTHPVPVSIEALTAYKAQKIPYKSAPESLFCMATLSAFSDILGTVTSKWSEAKGRPVERAGRHREPGGEAEGGARSSGGTGAEGEGAGV